MPLEPSLETARAGQARPFFYRAATAAETAQLIDVGIQVLDRNRKRRTIMTLSLYSTWGAWRRDVAAERATSTAGNGGESPLYEAIALLGVGLAGIA